MSEQNKAHAALLRQLAGIYENAATDLKPTGMTIHVLSKSDLIDAIKGIGGKWTKHTGDYFVTLKSDKIPGLELMISRDSVCRKIVSYECEPLLSAEDDAELTQAATA